MVVVRPEFRLMVTAVLVAGLLALHMVAGAARAGAQTQLDGEIDALNILSWDGAAEEPGLTGAGRGRMDLRSQRDRNIKARFTIDALLTEAMAGGGQHENIDSSPSAPSVAAAPGIVGGALFSVPRASLRFRFPVTANYTVRVTTGRDRVSWGHGALFNAADVIFGADGTGAADFRETGDDLRNETAWLTSVYLPLGDVAFAEPVVLPALPDPAAPGQQSVDRTRAGGRVSFEIGRFTLEPGYLYDPADDRHDMVLSAQGLLGIDVYGGARLALDPDIDRDNVAERSTFSLGAYHRERVTRDLTVDARLEALVRPGAGWQDTDTPDAEYGLSVYPELIVTPSPTVSLIARSIISPIDRSARLTTGVNWNVFGGFDMLAFGDVQLGDTDSVFSFRREAAASLTTGVRYRF